MASVWVAVSKTAHRIGKIFGNAEKTIVNGPTTHPCTWRGRPPRARVAPGDARGRARLWGVSWGGSSNRGQRDRAREGGRGVTQLGGYVYSTRGSFGKVATQAVRPWVLRVLLPRPSGHAPAETEVRRVREGSRRARGRASAISRRRRREAPEVETCAPSRATRSRRRAAPSAHRILLVRRDAKSKRAGGAKKRIAARAAATPPRRSRPSRAWRLGERPLASARAQKSRQRVRREGRAGGVPRARRARLLGDLNAAELRNRK